MLPKGGIKKILSHPNSLTLFRILAVPIIVILLLFPNRLCTFLAAIIFSAAAITDYLDGYLARRRGLVTDLGKVMDPVADKLLVSCIVYYAGIAPLDTRMDGLHHYRQRNCCYRT